MNNTLEKSHWESFKDADAVNRAIWNHDDKKVDACLNMIIPALETKLNPGSRIFDLGCGTGRLLVPFAKRYTDVDFLGIDFSAPMIKFAVAAHNIYYRKNDGITIPIIDEYFDAGFSMIMFQHIENEVFANYLKEVARVLKHGGIFRFQFVEGVQQHFLSHHALVSDVDKWIVDAGLVAVSLDSGLDDVWKWVTVIK